MAKIFVESHHFGWLSRNDQFISLLISKIWRVECGLRVLPAHYRWFGDMNAVPSRDSENRVVSGAMKVGPTKSVRSRRWVTLLQFCKAPRGLLGNLMTLWRRDWSLRLFVVVLQGSVDGENDEEVSKLGLFQITHSHNSETPSYVWLNS